MDDYRKQRLFEKVLGTFNVTMMTLFYSSVVVGIIAVISGVPMIESLFFAIIAIAISVGFVSLVLMAIGIVFGFFRLY